MGADNPFALSVTACLLVGGLPFGRSEFKSRAHWARGATAASREQFIPGQPLRREMQSASQLHLNRRLLVAGSPPSKGLIPSWRSLAPIQTRRQHLRRARLVWESQAGVPDGSVQAMDGIDVALHEQLPWCYFFCGAPSVSGTVLRRCFDSTLRLVTSMPPEAGMEEIRFSPIVFHFAVAERRVHLTSSLRARCAHFACDERMGPKSLHYWQAVSNGRISTSSRSVPDVQGISSSTSVTGPSAGKQRHPNHDA